MKVEPSYHPLYGTSGRGVPYRRGARRNPLFCQGYRGDRNQNGSHISDGIEDKSDPSVRFFYYLGIFVSYHDPNEIFTLRCHRPDRLFPAPGPNPGRQSAGRRVLSLSERLRRALQPDDRHRFVGSSTERSKVRATCSGTPRTSNSHSWPTTAAENRTGPTGCR